MNWEDTVMSQKEIDIIDEAGVIDGDIVPYLNRQAELSFKAGEKLALEKQGQAYLEGKQAGVKEVVEWIKASGDASLYTQQGEYTDEWRAKLKEWIK